MQSVSLTLPMRAPFRDCASFAMLALVSGSPVALAPLSSENMRKKIRSTRSRFEMVRSIWPVKMAVVTSHMRLKLGRYR